MKLKGFDSNKLFFTSDNHFGHKNIIEYCNRPFQDEFYQTEALIDNWNSVVPEDGTVFLLGDFAMNLKEKDIADIINRLNGDIILVLGNHDYQNDLYKTKFNKYFKLITDVLELTVKDDELSQGYCKLFMSHYPHLYWLRGAYHLHGHIHSGPTSTASEPAVFHPMRYDIGVDNNNYRPISYNEMKIIITKQMLNNRFLTNNEKFK